MRKHCAPEASWQVLGGLPDFIPEAVSSYVVFVSESWISGSFFCDVFHRQVYGKTTSDEEHSVLEAPRKFPEGFPEPILVR
jgi:hypothetical protein